ncbi:hypothetical protein SK128_005143 [Halocaridina rubra]|uniref:Uncharacterized protein n=1 Tax=Halocaridina rubra TaxID=373956 RepID=A0AAN8XJB8_HALRR
MFLHIYAQQWTSKPRVLCSRPDEPSPGNEDEETENDEFEDDMTYDNNDESENASEEEQTTDSTSDDNDELLSSDEGFDGSEGYSSMDEILEDYFV